MDTKHPHSEIIDALGGTAAVARIFRIKAPSVSDWRNHGIPEARLMYLQLAFPHLFPKDQGRRSAKAERKEPAHA
jgi:hypothetical protein